MKKGNEIDPEDADTHCNLGLAYYEKEMYDEEIAEYKKTIEIDPNYAVAHNNVAISYYDKGEYSLAIKHCDRAIELEYSIHPELLELLEPYREKSE